MQFKKCLVPSSDGDGRKYVANWSRRWRAGDSGPDCGKVDDIERAAGRSADSELVNAGGQCAMLDV